MMVVGVSGGCDNDRSTHTENYFFMTSFKNDDDRLTCSFDYFFLTLCSGDYTYDFIFF